MTNNGPNSLKFKDKYVSIVQQQHPSFNTSLLLKASFFSACVSYNVFLFLVCSSKT